MPNAQVCVYLTVHITQLQLQINIFKTSLYHIPHVFIRTLAAENLDVCTACDPWDSNIQLILISKFWGSPPGPGMPFLDSDTCARGRGVIYFCQGFLPCMMPSTDGWQDGWMDGRVTWWKKLHEKQPQRPLLYVIVHIHAISLGQKKWQRTKVGLKKTLLSMSWGSIHPWGSGFFSFWGRMRV